MIQTESNSIANPDVLIVDDSADVRLLLKTVLGKMSLSAIEASDGEEALKVLSHTAPQVVVSDIRMPRMNGYELLHAVRASGTESASVPFIMLTGLNDNELASVAKKLGVSAFFSKPLDVDGFRTTIRGMLGSTPTTDHENVSRSIGNAPDRTKPERADSIERLEQLVSQAGPEAQAFGNIICLGTEEIQRRVGDDHWDRLKQTIAKLMVDAVAAVCRPEDVYLSCDDGSVIIVFGDNDLVHAEAAAAKAAKQVTDALFGSDEMNGVKVTSIVQTSDGYITEGKKNVSEIIDSLLKLAQRHNVSATAKPEPPPAKPAPAPAPKRKDKNEGKGRAVPSFREELMSRIDSGKDNPIEFCFLPIWDIQNRRVDQHICLPSRATGIQSRPQWGYNVLGQSPSLAEIVELDIACLEFGLLEVMTPLSAGKSVSVAVSVNFETLASKNSREKLLGLLREIPGHLRSHVSPILTHAPDGIPEMRIREITAELRSLTNQMAVELFPGDEGKNIMKTIARLRGGGIEVILTRVPDDSGTNDIQIAQRIGERVRQLGGKSGVAGVRNPATLMDLAYSSLDFCTGKSIGGPFDHVPDPYVFDAKTLEGMAGAD